MLYIKKLFCGLNKLEKFLTPIKLNMRNQAQLNTIV